MPRPRPPHLHKQTSRHGKTVWYFRMGHGPRVRIPGEYGSPEFIAAYKAALYGEANPPTPKIDSRSLQWLAGQYRKSADWAKLGAATRRQRENIFIHVLSTAGHLPFEAIGRRQIMEGIDKRRETPFAGRHFLYSMRGLMQWAVKHEYVAADPTAGISAPTPETGGFEPWTDSEIARYEAKWPLGSRERLALALFLYTGLRRGDAADLGPQHVQDGVISLKTQKTGTPVIIPILPELQAVIDATPAGKDAFITGERGNRMTKESLGNWFREACDAAGVKKSAHGLRKSGATRAAENGATVAQLEAIFGWTGGRMASHYTKTVDRARLARDAMTTLSARKKD